MSKEEILNVLKKSTNNITIELNDGSEYLLCRNKTYSINGKENKKYNLWNRKVWGSVAYLTDEELSEELAEDSDNIKYIYSDF